MSKYAGERNADVHYLNTEVDNFQAGDGLWSHYHRTQGVEEWLKDHPQQLCEGVVEEATFQTRRDVHIQLIITLVLMMFLTANTARVSVTWEILRYDNPNSNPETCNLQSF